MAAASSELEPIMEGMNIGQTIEQFRAGWGGAPGVLEKCSELVDTVVRFLQQNTELSVHNTFKGGSNGKNLFFIPTSTDLELILVLNDLKSIQDMKTKNRDILHRIKAKFDSASWHFGSVSFIESDLRLKLSVQPFTVELTQVKLVVDIYPVFDVLRNRSLQDVLQEMRHVSEEDRRLYAVCLTPKQVEFIKEAPSKLQDLLKVLKYMFKKEITSDISASTAYFIEVLALYRWHKAGRPNDFNLSDWFEEVVSQLADVSGLQIVLEKHYTVGRYCQLPPAPFVLDPVNPYNNIIPPPEVREKIKKHARRVLTRIKKLKKYLNEGPPPVQQEMRRGQNLQQFIVETIEPDSDFRRKCVDVVEHVTSFLQQKTEFSVNMVIKGGSLGKSTNIKGKSDVDLVVYINSLATVQDLQRNMDSLLDTLERDLQASWRGKLKLIKRTPYGLQYQLSCGETGHLHDVDILPACYVLKDKTLDQVHNEMLTRSEREREFYNVCFAKKQVDFVKETPIKVKNFIRLVKYWAKTELNTEQKKVVTSYFLECLVMYNWIEWGSPDDFNTNDRFKEVMTQLANISSMRVVWPRRYNVSHLFDLDMMYPGRIPIFLDPQNPFRNLAPFDKNKGLVAERARSVLQKIEDMKRYRAGKFLDN